MDTELIHRSYDVYLRVDPGICGFPCIVCAQKLSGRKVKLCIEGSECRQINRLSELIGQIDFKDILRPITANPIFISADRAGCHSSCPVPTALIKVAEVALGLALQHDVIMHFQI